MRTQNYRFDMALNNMSQGLVMFDGEKRLIVCNEAYSRLYALPPELRKPGTSLQAILEHRAATGSAEVGSMEQFISGRMTVADQGKRLSETHDLVDGRSIFILHEPMAGGGWVATHEDVTERRDRRRKSRAWRGMTP